MDIGQAISLHQAGRVAEARTAYEEILARAPSNFDAWQLLGLVHGQLGQSRDAAHCFEKAIALAPENPGAHFNLGLALFELNRPADAIRCCERALAIDSGNPQAHYTLGNMLHGQGRLDEAIERFRQALVHMPDFPDALNNLGIALQELGKLDEARASFRRALACDPDFSEAHGNLGMVLYKLGLLDEATACLQRALSLKPNDGEAHSNLGTVLLEQGKLDEAAACLHRALSLRPDLAKAHYNLGKVRHAQGDLDAAIESSRRALSIKPDYAEALCNLGVVLKEQGKLEEAAVCLERALVLEPNFAVAHRNLGIVLRESGRPNQAAASFQRAVSLEPGDGEAHAHLGAVHHKLGNYEAAIESLRDAIARIPEHAQAHLDLGNVLYDLGKLDAAIENYRKALALKPEYALAHSNLLFLYGHQSFLASDEYLLQAREWERLCLSGADRQIARKRTFQRLPLAGRRLRVGYLSGDFCEHAASHFTHQLLSHHDRERIELFAYSNSSLRDAMTGRLQALTDHWTNLVGMSDSAARDRIDADDIDVLIDLSGHTAQNRLKVIALRAAPVQAHYLGFFASTGLTEMDYWIGDDVLTPPETDAHFSEQVWRLPRTWVSYAQGADAPPSNWRPAEDGSIWLGSFNRLSKLTPATMALWASVLHALPEGRLLLKTRELADAGNRQRILDALAGHGIAASRIELQDGRATPDWQSHMAYYDRLDISLDPVGAVGGGTTTCDALWMAVPVVTLMGDRLASRMTASMLNALGRSEWIARSEVEYIDKVVGLARDVGKRKAFRPAQRGQMSHSPLCNAGDLAQNLEIAYGDMFQRWFNANGART